MSKLRVLSEFFSFLREQKKFWIMPIMIILALLGILTVVSQNSAVTPFIYTLF